MNTSSPPPYEADAVAAQIIEAFDLHHQHVQSCASEQKKFHGHFDRMTSDTVRRARTETKQTYQNVRTLYEEGIAAATDPRSYHSDIVQHLDARPDTPNAWQNLSHEDRQFAQKHLGKELGGMVASRQQDWRIAPTVTNEGLEEIAKLEDKEPVRVPPTLTREGMEETLKSLHHNASESVKKVALTRDAKVMLAMAGASVAVGAIAHIYKSYQQRTEAERQIPPQRGVGAGM